MTEYGKEIVEAWDKAEKLSGDGFIKVKSKCGKKSRTTAAPEDLFKINEDSMKLNSDMATAFHNIVAKVLYMVKRARPDASVPIAFLTTRVRSPDIDDWRKLCTGELEEQQSRHLFTKIQKDTMLTACEIERQLGDKD